MTFPKNPQAIKLISWKSSPRLSVVELRQIHKFPAKQPKTTKAIKSTFLPWLRSHTGFNLSFWCIISCFFTWRIHMSYKLWILESNLFKLVKIKYGRIVRARRIVEEHLLHLHNQQLNNLPLFTTSRTSVPVYDIFMELGLYFFVEFWIL